MANSPLTDQERLTLAVDLFSSTTVAAIFYTFTFLLYCMSFRLSYAQLWHDQGKINQRTVYKMVFQTVLFLCATMDVVEKNGVVRVLYIDKGGLLGGLHSSAGAHSVATFIQVDIVVTYLKNALIFGVLVWRVWVIWSGTSIVMLLTGVSLFFYLGFAGLALFYIAMLWSLEPPPQLQATLYKVNMTIEAFSLAGYIFMTSAIIARLLIARQEHMKVLGNSDVSSQYWGIAAMLIESYALHTVWSIGLAISVIGKYLPSQEFFSSCDVQVDIFLNFLLIYRVLSGRAWTRQTQSELSTVRWAPNGAITATCGTVDIRHTNVVEKDRSMTDSSEDM